MTEEADRRVRELEAHLARKDEDLHRLADVLRSMEGSAGWLFSRKLSQARSALAPPGTLREQALVAALRPIKKVLRTGLRTAIRQATEEARRQARLRRIRRHAGAPPAGAPGRVLFLSGTFGDMERYRCRHPEEQLALAGVAARVLRAEDAPTPAAVTGCDVVVVQRMAWSPAGQRLVDAVRRSGARLLFDVDDLVFDEALLDRIDALRVMEPGEAALFRESAARYRRTMDLCDGVLVTTEPLARAVASSGKPVWVHRNAPSLEMWDLADAARASRRSSPDRVVLGYASGSRTHDRDFAEVADALERILDEDPRVELRLLGYLDPGPRFERFGPRVTRHGFVPWRRLAAELAAFDVSLAPLEAGNPFCEAKSELKWLEASSVGIPTVASATETFAAAIHDGETGLLARTPEEWLDRLRRLVADEPLCRRIGEAARVDVRERWGAERLGRELVATLRSAVSRESGAGAP